MSSFIKFLRAWLHSPDGTRRPIAYLSQYGDILRVSFDADYVADPLRPVLSLSYTAADDALTRSILTSVGDRRLSRSDGHWPSFFMNLLPESHNRTRLARERGCAEEDEFELLAAAGHDLMGALEVEPVAAQDGVPDAVAQWHTSLSHEKLEAGHVASPVEDGSALPGVVDKFSAIKDGRRYVVKRHGDAGAFILKLPSTRHPDLVQNEFTGYRLCAALGLDCARAEIVARSDADLPDHLDVPHVLAVERFDRAPGTDGRHRRIHFEEFCQALGYEPRQKYGQGLEDFSAMAAILDRLSSSPVTPLVEFVSRFVAFILMGNCDAHLKNWGLLYADGRTPALAPLYDPVCVTAFFADVSERDYGVNRAIDAKLKAFDLRALDDMLVDAKLTARRRSRLLREARDVVSRARSTWPALLVDAPDNVRRSVLERLEGGLALTAPGA